MKISGITVFVFALALCMVIITTGLAKRDPIVKTTQAWAKYRDAMATEQQKWPLAVKRVQDASALAQTEVDKWKEIAATRTLPPPPDPNGVDLSKDPETLILSIPDFRNRVQAAVNDQVKVGGVEVVDGPRVPTAPTDPDRILSGFFNYPQLAPVLVFNLGSVTVRGTYKQISDNVRAWSNMPHFLAVADGLRLQGTAPKLTGVYALSIVGFVQVPPEKAIFPAIPQGGRRVLIPGQAAVGKEAGAAGVGTNLMDGLASQAAKMTPAQKAALAKQVAQKSGGKVTEQQALQLLNSAASQAGKVGNGPSAANPGAGTAPAGGVVKPKAGPGAAGTQKGPAATKTAGAKPGAAAAKTAAAKPAAAAPKGAAPKAGGGAPGKRAGG